MKPKRTYYYSKEQNDDYQTPPKKLKKIGGDFIYIRKGFFAKLLAFFAYRIIATPIAFVYSRIIKRISFRNRKVLKPYLKKGYFIFSNHTQVIGDALTPNIIVFPKRNYTIVSPANVSLPIMGNFTKLLGALPLPDDLKASRNFFNAIETRINQGHSVLIYPEAHVWPNYTQIRSFSESSFKYPVKHETPVFSLTTTYQKKKHQGYKTVIYVDGPFTAPKDLGPKEQQINLRNQVFNVMCERAKQSNFEKFRYELKEQV